jgi:hypothetical protein
MMGKSEVTTKQRWILWAARAAVAAVCASNLSAAIPFALNPGAYTRGFEVAGVGGEALVRALGVAFLMWQVAYVPVIWNPRNRACFHVILAMQVVGLAGEAWMVLSLPEGHAALMATGQRFIMFDGAGLVVLALAYLAVWLAARRDVTPAD